jgi:hypothetical protein
MLKPLFQLKKVNNSAVCQPFCCGVFTTIAKSVDFLQKRLALSHKGN